jgi:SAM-dependent MidA family methyltransferase
VSELFVDWREAWQRALYGPDGFYRKGSVPSAHFRTSMAAADLMGGALVELARREGLRRVVDVGSGRGELLAAVHARDPGLELVGTDVVARPQGLPDGVRWVVSDGGATVADDLGGVLRGALVVAHEWLDDVPCTVCERDADGAWRVVEVARDGRERLGGLVGGAERAWLDRWWTTGEAPAPGDRAEVGAARDAAWAAVVGASSGCLLVAVDYDHAAGARPPHGTLLGYRDGAACPPVPDGGCDVTAHVALDAVADAGERAGARETRLERQREVLGELGVSGSLPDVSLAATDPRGYVAALSTASRAAELLDPAGLGGFGWLLQRT